MACISLCMDYFFNLYRISVSVFVLKYLSILCGAWLDKNDCVGSKKNNGVIVALLGQAPNGLLIFI